MTKEELQKIIAIDEGFRIELTTSKDTRDRFISMKCRIPQKLINFANEISVWKKMQLYYTDLQLK